MTHFRTAGAFAVSLAACVSIVVAGASDSARADEAGHWAAIVSPTPAYDQCVVIYRPASRQLIEFGGLARGIPSADVRTFSLDAPGAGWTRLEIVGKEPPSRFAHVGIFDPVRDRLVIFGGSGYSGWLRDAWALDLSGTPTWHALKSGANPPTATLQGAATYDSARDRMLYFGGSRDNFLDISNELFALPLGNDSGWQALSPTGSVLALTDHTMIYDASRDVAIVFGGVYGGESNATYQLALEPSLSWSVARTTYPAPEGRRSHSAIYDAAHRRMVVWGGRDGAALKNDVWTLALDGTYEWTKLAPSGSTPAPQWWPRAVWDGAHTRLLTTSGSTKTFPAAIPRSDVSALSLGSSPAWTTLWVQPDSPRGGTNQTLLLDTARRRLYLFDPYTSVYRMSLDSLGKWTNLTPAAHPPDPAFSAKTYAVVFDSLRNRILVEHGAAQTSGGIWELSLASAGASWTQLPVTPWVGDGNSLVLDPSRDRLIRFGGLPYYHPPYYTPAPVQTLALGPLGAWTNYDPAGLCPPTLVGHCAILDRARDRMLVTGGGRFSSYGSPQLYTIGLGLCLDSLEWEWPWCNSPAPGECARCGLLIDTNRDRLLRVGDYPDNSLWAGTLGDTLAWERLHPSGPGPSERYELSAVYDGSRDRVYAFGGGETGFDDTLFVLDFQATSVGVMPAGPAPQHLALSRLWPNPTSSRILQFELTTRRAERVRLEVFDLAGRCVVSRWFEAPGAGTHLGTLPLDEWGGGIFWLRASDGSGSQSLRFAQVH